MNEYLEVQYGKWKEGTGWEVLWCTVITGFFFWRIWIWYTSAPVSADGMFPIVMVTIISGVVAVSSFCGLYRSINAVVRLVPRLLCGSWISVNIDDTGDPLYTTWHTHHVAYGRIVLQPKTLVVRHGGLLRRWSGLYCDSKGNCTRLRLRVQNTRSTGAAVAFRMGKITLHDEPEVIIAKCEDMSRVGKLPGKKLEHLLDLASFDRVRQQEHELAQLKSEKIQIVTALHKLHQGFMQQRRDELEETEAVLEQAVTLHDALTQEMIGERESLRSALWATTTVACQLLEIISDIRLVHGSKQLKNLRLETANALHGICAQVLEADVPLSTAPFRQHLAHLYAGRAQLTLEERIAAVTEIAEEWAHGQTLADDVATVNASVAA